MAVAARERGYGFLCLTDHSHYLREGRLEAQWFTKALAREVASRQITVNAIAPGFIPTALTNDLSDELKESILKYTPLGRKGKPEEVAAAVAFLMSEDAGYITRQVLSVNGGLC